MILYRWGKRHGGQIEKTDTSLIFTKWCAGDTTYKFIWKGLYFYLTRYRDGTSTVRQINPSLYSQQFYYNGTGKILQKEVQDRFPNIDYSTKNFTNEILKARHPEIADIIDKYSDYFSYGYNPIIRTFKGKNVEELIRKKVKGKKLRKMCYENPFLYILYSHYWRAGLRNLDVLQKSLAKITFINDPLVLNASYKRYYAMYPKFIADWYHRGDVIYMLEGLGWPQIEARNEKELHDELVRRLRIQGYKKDIKLEYEHSFSVDYKDYEVEMPQISDEVINYGSIFNNCVASYIPKLNKRHNIISLKRNGQYRGCIEVKNGKIIQASGYNNKPLERDDKIALEKIKKDLPILERR